MNGFLKMMDADEATGPMNLGNPSEFTMIELARLVLELTGSKSELTLQPLPADDPTQRQPDITLAKGALDWEPTIPLAEGLQKTIAWFSSIDVSAWTPPTPNWGGGLIER
jgi:UDP-glucuronate decarboxylase